MLPRSPRFASPLAASAVALVAAGLATPSPARAQEATTLDRVVVSATRSAQPVENLPLAIDVFSSAELRASPSLALDDTLRGSTAFGLFRRSGSLTANPTAQGVSLRGLGPSGASRSLVLLDGIPLNDPFGGWVAWTKLPREALVRAEIVRGGGSGTWGNAALGGTVQLFTAPPSVAASASEWSVTLGDFSTRAADFSLTTSTGSSSNTSDAERARSGGALRVTGGAFTTDGFPLVRADRRGPIDRASDLDYQRAQATWLTPLNATTTLSVDARLYAEERGNGTPLQRNRSREAFASATLTGAPSPALAWTANAYVQRQAFESFFSSVNATRTTETPANDQFDVPATAAGASLTSTWRDAARDATTTAGVDVRRVEGETREDFTFSATTGGFTRRRFAGGEQLFAGAFAHHERALAPTLRASLAARADLWHNRDGHRREIDLTSPVGAAVRDDRYANADGVEFSPTAGLVWAVASGVRVRGAAYRAFRVPTLNELYRPFRVGAVSTDANPALAVETLLGGELGITFGETAANRATTTPTLEVSVFSNDLDDAVTNLTLAPNSRQRRNLPGVRVRGLEVGARWTPWPALRLRADYALTDARVTESAAIAPALTGRRLAQTPRQTLALGATWDAPGDVSATARVRRVDAQFEDDENALPLAAATTCDASLQRAFGRGGAWQVTLAVENVFNATVETGRSADGIVNIAPPRFAHASVRLAW